MRFREPLLGGSAAMPGASLQRACRLLVAVCALHLGVTLVYYLSGRDLSRLPYLVGVPPPPAPVDATSQPRRGSDSSSPDAASLPGLASNWTSAPGSPVTAPPLPACPEESPLLGKDSVGASPRTGTRPGFPDSTPPPGPGRAPPLLPGPPSRLFRISP